MPLLLFVILLLFACTSSPQSTPVVPATPDISNQTDSSSQGRSEAWQPPTPTTNPEVSATSTTEPTKIQPTEPAVTPILTDPNSHLVLDTRTIIAFKAARLAADTMPGPYSWQEFRQCSTFVSAYLRQLSFPVDGMHGENATYPDPFPWSNVVYQVNWARRNYPEFTHDAPVLDFLEGKLWDQIKPGDVLYFQTVDSHNGLDDYFHTVILIGYHSDGSPQFAEIAGGMPGVSVERTFDEMTNFYKKNGAWHITPVDLGGNLTPPYLKVTWFDPLAILNKGKLWQKPGPVTPNSSLLDSFDQVVTINIYDGTTTIFAKTDSTWQPVNIDGRHVFYAGLGRLLPANKTITAVFDQKRPYEIYDGDFGIYLSQFGVYQHTWTPQMFARLTGFDYINGFGGLSGGTDTSLLKPQIYTPDGIGDNWDYSSFTFHRVPDVKNQDMLLRVDLLKKANDPNGYSFGPIPVPQVYLSSGCINFDPGTWQIIKNYLKSQLEAGQKIAVIFSYPNFDQNLLPTIDVFKSAFTGAPFNEWCYNNSACNPLDARDYRLTYLDK